VELRHLRYFIAVIEAGTFTLAAERLHTVQPSLSRQIRDLEEFLGVALLERSTRSVKLTEAGEIFLSEARLVLAQAERAIDRARRAASTQQPRLTVGVLQGVEISKLVTVINALHVAFPKVELTLQSRSSPELIDELIDRKIDLAFIRPSVQSKKLRLRTVRREGIIAALPAGHSLANRSSMKLSEIRDETFISVPHEFAPVLSETIRALVREKDLDLKWTYEAENVLMALSLIRSAGAVCLLPESYVAMFPRGVVAVVLEDVSLKLELALAWHPENRAPALQTFLRAFTELNTDEDGAS
jgi:LysR family transcriptional regulator, hca operon transcriptional activator